MPGMVLRLSPAHPVVWLTPDSLQVGFETPLAVLDPVPPGADALLAVLARGIADAPPATIAVRLGLPPQTVDDVLRLIEPALVRDGPPLAGRVVRIEGADRSPVAALAEQVTALGGEAVTVLGGVASTEASRDFVDLAILVFRFAVQPRRCASFTSADIPVLPVVFGEGSAIVGPVLAPGGLEGAAGPDRAGPCAWCLHLGAVDADALWEIKAIQAAARPAASTSARGVAAVAAQTATELLRWARPGPPAPPRRVEIDLREHPAESPATVTAVSPHPECACRALPGTVRAHGRPSAWSPAGPTTGTGASARG